MCNYQPKPLGQKSATDFEARKQKAAHVRNQARNEAKTAFDTTPPLTNGDQEDFEKLGLPGFASFTKALKHDDDGFVTPDALNSFLAAIEEGSQAAFEKIELGGERKLVNPLNAYSYQLIGDDSHGARMAPAPKFNSRNTAVDMVERYWMALCRDIPFDQYADSKLIRKACDDLTKIGFEEEFGFSCTPETIFRGPYQGCDVGPHVSQFLLQDFFFGNQKIQQRQQYPKPGLDYLTDIDTWKKVNNGDIDPTGSDVFEGERYITTLRDAGQWVHIDLPHQSGLWATLILLARSAETTQTQANPYINGPIEKSEAFGSLGGPDITIQAGLAGVYGLKHAWFQKWCVHRRLRPEVYAQRLEWFRSRTIGKQANAPFNDQKFQEVFGEGAEIWRQTRVLDLIFKHNQKQNVAQSRGNCQGSWLLPMGFPEGSPTHPAYPGGHSVFIAAAATVAKAFFKDAEFVDPKVPAKNGKRLVDYKGEPLTIHGELNKLIANITLFRDGAGMHWRTDGTATGDNAQTGYQEVPNLETGGNLLGEKLAISMLRDTKQTYREVVEGFEFRGISGDLENI